MSWKLVLLFVVVVSLIVGPVMMLKPRPAQLRRERLRLQARHLGLGFALRVPPALKTDLEPLAPMPCYFLGPQNSAGDNPSWVLRRTSYSHEANFWQEWDWVGESRPSQAQQVLLKGLLAQVPAGALALSSGPGGVSIYWDEREGESSLEPISLLLTQLQAAG